VLRYMHDSTYFKANANTSNSDYPNGVLAADAWPEIYQDFQSAGLWPFWGGQAA